MSEDLKECSEKNEELLKKQYVFLAKIGHELHNQAHGICGVSDSLDKNWEMLNDDAKRNIVKDIYKSSEILETLLDSLLNFSKVSSDKIEMTFAEFEIIPMVEEAIKQSKMHRSFKNHVAIKLEQNLIQPTMVGDVFWLRQLITNIVANAIKYSQKGTVVVNVGVKLDGEEKFLHISVTDEGIGIPELELDHIFEPFKQSSRGEEKKSSFGLGLAICREVVESHKGKIWAQNNSKVGAKVEFKIPI
ncbi:MAG: HAMP domain-containing histidine kinase [Rickettsiaceae bacterium]|nr:HAMP domain-containing histidine kinase [Rickettsiaceae bacterium]